MKQGIHEIHKLQSYPYVSFIPVNEVVALSLNGFKYNLNNQPLEKGSTLTLSNEVKRKLHKSKYMMDKSYKLEVEMQIKIKNAFTTYEGIFSALYLLNSSNFTRF